MAGTNTELKTPRGDVDAVLAELGDHYVSAPVDTPDGGQIVFISEKLTAKEIKPLNPKLPDFVTASLTVIEPTSFKEYIIAFKSSTAICRASLGQNNIVAVLDYHGDARKGDREEAVPQRCTHSVTLSCPYDLDYAKWKKIFDEPLSQNDFGNVLEDLVHTIAEPAVADLEEAIDSLRIDKAVRFQSKVNRRNGNVTFVYDEVDSPGQTDSGGTVSLPEEVKIVVSIFQGGPAIQLTAKLRYRLDKGQVKFILVVPGLDAIERDQFRRIAEDVRQVTNTPVFYTT